MYRLTPDGQRYQKMARGQREPIPFHLRWLLPWALGGNLGAWLVINVLSIATVGVLTYLLAIQHGATEIQGAVAAALLLGLPWIRFAWFAPVLIDTPGLALALGAAVLWPISPIGALGLALLAGAVSEKAPVWAGIFALQPLLLVGLLAPLARLIMVKPGEPKSDDPLGWTLNPFRAGLRGHAGKWRSAHAMLAPWGVCLIVALGVPSLWLLIALAVGYGQLLVATDTVREYQQAAPVVCIAAAVMIPEAWIGPALLAHWFNPWAGGGY